MNSIPNRLVFIAGSVVGGLALAFVVVALRPGLITGAGNMAVLSGSPAPVATAPASSPGDGSGRSAANDILASGTVATAPPPSAASAGVRTSFADAVQLARLLRSGDCPPAIRRRVPQCQA